MGTETVAERAYWFTFEHGRYRPMAPPPEADSDGDMLRAMGYSEGQQFGDTNGTSFELWEKEDGFLVVFQTPGRFCYLRCPSWPDLIELLAKLAPIALAGAVEQDRYGGAFLSVRTKTGR